LKRLQKRNQNLIFHPTDIVYCSKCNFDLRNARISKPLDNETEINRIHFTQYTLGYGKAGNLQFLYSNLYFEGIRRLLSFLICSTKGKPLFAQLKKELEISDKDHFNHILKNEEPERANLEHRRLGLQMIYYLLQGWPDRFVDACKKSNISTHHIYSPYLTFPFWISDVIRCSIYNLPPTLSARERLSVYHYFSRTLNREVKNYELTILVKKIIR
jgi:hypothetical protein